jgi:hypothetical protein
MKLASKILAAFAVMASFSSFALDIQQDAITDIADAQALANANTDGPFAAIVQSAGSQAFISQEGTQSAVISQSSAGAFASIVQSGDANIAAIVQK